MKKKATHWMQLFLCTFLILIVIAQPVFAQNNLEDLTSQSDTSGAESVESSQDPQESTASEEGSSTAAAGTVGSKNITNYSKAIFKWVWAPILGIAVSLFLLIFINVRAYMQNRKKKEQLAQIPAIRKLIVRKRRS